MRKLWEKWEEDEWRWDWNRYLIGFASDDEIERIVQRIKREVEDAFEAGKNLTNDSEG